MRRSAATPGETVTIIAIGPLTNLARALQREPRIAAKARVVAIAGSVRRGMFNAPGPQREYNVNVDREFDRYVRDTLTCKKKGLFKGGLFGLNRG